MLTTKISEALAQAAVCGTVALSVVAMANIGSFAGLTARLPFPSADAEGQAQEQELIMTTMSGGALSTMLSERTALLEKSVTVELIAGTGTVRDTMTLSLADHPVWVVYELSTNGRGRAVVNPHQVAAYLAGQRLAGSGTSACDITKEWVDDYGVRRADTSCIGRERYTYDSSALAITVKQALEHGEERVRFPLTAAVPVITGRGASGSLVTGTLTLLSGGQSNFAGSGDGRKANVKKAIDEHVNNVIVPRGAVFSFNATLGKSIDAGNGWYMALTIFNGGDLLYAPGGGICQASTTLYRAALNAGLPMISHKNHSLYVYYYEAYGAGLDATVFPGQQDMTFRNDTPGPLLIQSYHEGDDAFVRIYGVDDHRTVSMSGPYFTSTIPADIAGVRSIKINEIAWSRTVTSAEGQTNKDLLVSHYTMIPKILKTTLPAVTTLTRGEVTKQVASR